MAITRKVVAGQDIAAGDFRQFFGDHFSSFVKTGFEVTDDTGLDVSVSAGTAYVKDATDGMYQVVSDAIETVSLTDNSTNYVFLHSDNGANYLTDSTTATVPDDAICLAVVVTASGDVTSVTDARDLTPGSPMYGILSLHRATIGELVDPIYFNPSGDKIITFGTLKIRANTTSAENLVAVYNVGGGEQAITWTRTGSGNPYTFSAALDVSNSANITHDSYIKFTTQAVAVLNLSLNYIVQ